ncbi:MAG: MarR family winged helix-turn-helix transcriptional regulator [Lautropia sp.]
MKLASLIRKSASILYRHELDLLPAQWRALALIGDDRPLSLRALGDLMATDKGQTSRTVADLVARGWVRSDPNGRHVDLSLTPDGRALHRRLTVLSHRRNAALLAGLPARDIEALFRCLDVMTVNARQLLDAPQASPPPSPVREPPPTPAHRRSASTAGAGESRLKTSTQRRHAGPAHRSGTDRRPG